MRSKYRICEDRYDEFFMRLVRQKLVDFLSDERKRNRKSIDSAQTTTASSMCANETQASPDL
jgi:hypothetical protein